MCFGTGREVGARSLPVRASVDSTDLLIAKSTSGRKSCQLPQSTEVRKGVHTVRGVHVHVLACSRTSLYSRQDSRGQAEGSHAVCPSWRSLKPGSSRTREPVFGLVTIEEMKTIDTVKHRHTHLLTYSLTHSLTHSLVWCICLRPPRCASTGPEVVLLIKRPHFNENADLP